MRILAAILAGLVICLPTATQAQSSEDFRAAERCVAQSHRYQHHLFASAQLGNMRRSTELMQARIDSEGWRDSENPEIRAEVEMADRFHALYETWRAINNESGANEWLNNDCRLPRSADTPDIAAFLGGRAPSFDPLDRSDFHPAAIAAACEGTAYNYWCHAVITTRGFVSGITDPDITRVRFDARDRVCRSMNEELVRLESLARRADPGPGFTTESGSERMNELVMEALGSPESEWPHIYREVTGITEEVAEYQWLMEYGDAGYRLAKLQNSLDWDWCRRTGLDPRDNPDERTENWRYADELAWCQDSHAWIRRNRDAAATASQSEVDRFNRNVSVYNDRCVGIRAGSRDIEEVCGGDDEGFCGGFTRR